MDRAGAGNGKRPDWSVGGWGYIALVALLLALLGPYGTFVSMAFGTRVLFWGGSALCLTLLIRAAMWTIRRGLLPADWPMVVKRIVAAGMAAAPGGYLSAMLHDVLTGDQGPRPEFGQIYAYTILPTLLVTLLLGHRRAPAPPIPPLDTLAAIPEPAPRTQDVVSAFLARAVPRLADGRLLALEAEDHYLRVHTDRGSDLVLMRLRDAIAELVQVPGLQVHRSFWVAEAAVAQVARRGQGWQITLESGLTVPVSRNYGADLRAAGWPERFGTPVALAVK